MRLLVGIIASSLLVLSFAAPACHVPRKRWLADGGKPPAPLTPLPHEYIDVKSLPSEFT